MELAQIIRSVGVSMAPATLAQFQNEWKIRLIPKGRTHVAQGEITANEFILLNGQAISQITDSEGRHVCVGFHDGAGVITPHIARTRNGASLVSLEITSEATLASIDTEKLTELMLGSPQIRAWGNVVLHGELARKSDREWCLAALNGRERLKWFRDRYPNHEDRFPHNAIASFLGMTPVSLSRLRNTD